MTSKTNRSYTVESENKKPFKSFKLSLSLDDTIEKARFEITKRLGCCFDDFDIIIGIN